MSRQKYLPNASPTDLLIDNFNILLEGTQPDIEVLQQITTTVILLKQVIVYIN